VGVAESLVPCAVLMHIVLMKRLSLPFVAKEVTMAIETF
jgi:hypothetical protein